MKVQINVDIDDETIADQVTAALEGGSNYWIYGYRYLVPKEGYQVPAYADPQLYQDGQQYLELTDEDGTEHTLSRTTAQLGFQRLANSIYAPRLMQMLIGDADAEDADLWLQLALFGEVVYG